MIKSSVNQFQIFLRIFFSLTAALVISGCSAPARIEAAPPWRLLRIIPETTPQEQVALYLRPGQNQSAPVALLGWVSARRGEYNLPIRLVEGEGEPSSPGLGASPRRLSLHGLADGRVQLLWLDVVPPGETHLVGATLGAEGKLERGLNDLSKTPVVDYAAAPSPGGDLVVVWTEQGDGITPIYAQVIDGLGRPHTAVRVAANGRFPGAVVDSVGSLHLAWVEPGMSGLWTIRYAVFAGGQFEDSRGQAPTRALPGAPIGLITLGPSTALESFAFGLDSERAYCLWVTVGIGGDGRQIVGTLAGLTFPLGNSAETRSLTVDSGGASLRWPAFPARLASALFASLTVTRDENGELHSQPMLLPITPERVGPPQPVAALFPGQIGETRLALDTDGYLHLTWASLRPTGQVEMVYATNRPR